MASRYCSTTVCGAGRLSSPDDAEQPLSAAADTISATARLLTAARLTWRVGFRVVVSAGTGSP